MYTSALLLGVLAVLLDTASAHGFVKGVNIKGTFTNGSDPLWFYAPKDNRPKTAGWDALNQDIGFVEPANAGTADVNCHKSATDGRLYANVNPGDTIEFVWNTWPVGHTGPIINYIAPCNGISFPSQTRSHHFVLTRPNRRLLNAHLQRPSLVQNHAIRNRQPRHLDHRPTHQKQFQDVHGPPS